MLPDDYDVNLDHAHILFLSEEKNVGKIAKPGAFPASAGDSTFATTKRTTLATRSHWGSRNSFL